MFKNHLREILSLEYEKRILVIDEERIIDRYDYRPICREKGFKTVPFRNHIEFRFKDETELKADSSSILIYAKGDPYIPYDLLQRFYVVKLTWSRLFPSLTDPLSSGTEM